LLFVLAGVRLWRGRPVRRVNRREEGRMFAAIRYYRTTADSVDEVIRRVREGFVPVIRDTPGFVAYLVLAPRQNEVVSVSVFEDRSSAEESNKKAEEWVSQNLSELLPDPEFAEGDVVVYETR
jgi:heme-degrading monooxygenase HmoA